jgi:hypothetical protein
MRTRLLLPIVLTLLLGACGSATSSGAAPATGGNRSPLPAATSAPAGGKVDCSAIRTAGQELLSVQLLAQLTTPDAVASIKDKTIGNLDLDSFLAAMQQLHALDGYASPLGDPKAAIDAYETAARAAKVLFATTPVTQAAIDAYAPNVGTVAAFLGHQAAIAGAMDAAGC